MDASIKKLKQSDRQIVKTINEGDKAAFENLFFEYYSDLCLIAFKIVKCENMAEDVVQNVFMHLWSYRKKWRVNVSLRAYLYRAVRNQAINVDKKQKNREQVKKNFANESNFAEITEDNNTNEQQALVRKIWNIVRAMPKQRQFVFTLHRRHGLSYNEISIVMGISRKTVENHIGLALKQIRREMKQDILVNK